MHSRIEATIRTYSASEIGPPVYGAGTLGSGSPRVIEQPASTPITNTSAPKRPKNGVRNADSARNIRVHARPLLDIRVDIVAPAVGPVRTRYRAGPRRRRDKSRRTGTGGGRRCQFRRGPLELRLCVRRLWREDR